MIYAGILAAGIGVRMHRQDLPKPFLPLGEKPIIIHTLEQFLINPHIDKIIIVAHESWKIYAEDLLSKHDTMGKELSVISGGENKTVSMQMVVEYISYTWGIGENDILLNHDAIRPFITQRMIDDNIEAAQKYGAANTVMITNDTIVVTEDGQTLCDVPPKHMTLAEQTPQTYNLKVLDEVLREAVRQGQRLEDEMELPRLFLKQERRIQLVYGEYSNMKIINPYDLEVANALLKERNA